MSRITKESFGTMKNGEKAFLYTLEHEDGSSISISDYAGAVVSLKVPDKEGKLTDVVLGYPSVEAYEKQDMYMGVLIGRCANRIGNSRFVLNNKIYELEANEGKNHLHGTYAFRKFHVKEIANGFALSLFSEDMEEGYPGNLSLTVYYTFSENHEFCISYFAVSDKDTILNMTNHTYFNLAGHDSGSIEEQYIQIYSDYYTPSKEDSLPNGEIRLLKKTVFDFREAKRIGQDINADDIQLVYGNGYDHNFILNHEQGEFGDAAYAYCKENGICMHVKTDLPAMQLYSGNYLHDDPIGKSGRGYHKRDGFCLEAHFTPDSISFEHFPKPILKTGEVFKHKVSYKFETKR